MIAIVGGGITGLAAAHELTARGVPFQLFEASSRLGGLIQTEHVDGFTIEAGADSILAQKPAAIELCESLGLGPRLISTNPPRVAFVMKDRRLYPLPSPSVLGIPTTWRGIATYELLSASARARLALEPLIPRRRGAEDESVGAFFKRRFGGETVDLVAEPLLGGIHAGNVDVLSMTSLFPRFVEAEARHGSVLRWLRETRQPAAGDGPFRSLAGGMGELVHALERRMPEGSIRCDAPVAAIVRDGPRWHVSAAGTTATARAVILAVPARVASALLGPIDQRAGSLCGEVPYVSTVSVALAWPRGAVAHPLEGSGFVVARRHNNNVRMTACTWVSSKWSGRAPAGAVLLRVFAGGAHDPAIVDLPDDKIASIAVHDISGVLGTSGAPLVTRVSRWRSAGAQHHVGQLARVSEIEKLLAHHPGLFVAGSGFGSVGIPDCVADGRSAAAAACTSIE